LDAVYNFLQYGLTGWSWPALVIFTLATTHMTIAGVTIYLHRCQAHRAVELHPIVSHIFRFWLWLSTGMVTKEWASIHRKHHAKCETLDDPHSPQTRGLPEVLWRGAELYRVASKDQEIMDRYGHGCPDDWIERKLYSAHSAMGIVFYLFVDVLLFGVAGVAIWAVQMAWIPFFAAGVINGIGHFWGYRNFKSPDTSTNLLPWGILIGGEELHNNHHAHATSPKLSSKWYEFDVGWLYIKLLSYVGLAKPRAVPAGLSFNPAKQDIDEDTVAAVLRGKYEILAKLSKLAESAQVSLEKARVQQGRLQCDLVKRASELRQEFEGIWAQRSLSVEQAVSALAAWCQRAEASGIAAFQEFSQRSIRRLTVQPL
jgi:stearoyl-CoA desaturase (delta-9 desaturase)